MKILRKSAKPKTNGDEEPYSPASNKPKTTNYSHSQKSSNGHGSATRQSTALITVEPQPTGLRSWLARFLRKGQQQDTKWSAHTLRILDGVRSLQEISARELMIPRIDVDFLDKNSSTEELELTLSRSSHSRFPVYEETTDKVIGILYSKDLIPYWVEKKAFDVGTICRKPYFVPESMKVDNLLAEFQHRHVHIAMVVDEYGGISGIVCLEDILEEIVGDIQDEFDEEDEEIITLEKGVYICDARLNISSLNEELNLDLPAEDCDTVGGLLFSQLGKIPSRYEKVRYDNVEFVVHKLEGHRIESVKVILNESLPEEENPE